MILTAKQEELTAHISELKASAIIESILLGISLPPIFVYKNLKIDSIRALSGGKHLKLILKDDNEKILFTLSNEINNGLLLDTYTNPIYLFYNHHNWLYGIKYHNLYLS